MIFASRSSDSSSSKRMPLTVPAVPTGMNTGVSITPRRVVNKPARASPDWAWSSNSIGAIRRVLPQRRKDAKENLDRLIPLRLCAFAGELLMFFDNPQRRRKEVKLLPQTIQHVSLVREMQSRFPT